MLDTIILNLSPGTYRIVMPERFTPNARILYGPGNFLVRCVNNPNATDKKEGRYMPRLTLIKRPTKTTTGLFLKVEFSAPKILYTNNVREITAKDFPGVMVGLGQKLLDMGIKTTRSELTDQGSD